MVKKPKTEELFPSSVSNTADSTTVNWNVLFPYLELKSSTFCFSI